MARISYDEPTASAYKQLREIPRDGLTEWRDAVERHLRPTGQMTIVDIGAGTGQFASAFRDWFGVSVLAVEPSDAMRAQIPASDSLRVFEGDAMSLPLEDGSADAAWLSLVIHHVADLAAAAREIRRVLRPGAPVLIRQGYPDRYAPEGPLRRDGIEMMRWFPETARIVGTFPTLQHTCDAFAAAGLHRQALEQVRETRPESLADFLSQIDHLRQADTTLRSLSDEEFRRGKQRLERAVRDDDDPDRRGNWLELLVLR